MVTAEIITIGEGNIQLDNPIILVFLFVLAALGFTLSIVWRLKYEKILTKLKQVKRKCQQ